ncbi:hypothetical protein BGZ94_007121 [Podila epigama]|nr:hypothetical protein BGZ94_007121 [Podila epigama]
MKFALLSSVALSMVALSLAQNTPGPDESMWYEPGRAIANEQRLFLADKAIANKRNIQSLDLTSSWSSSAPAWSQPAPQPAPAISAIATLGLNKDASSLFVFETQRFQEYHIQKNEWSDVTPIVASIHGFTVTDTDIGQIYGFDKDISNGAQPFVMFDPASSVTVFLGPHPLKNLSWMTRGVYNSARKSLFYLTAGAQGSSDLFEFTLATLTWAPVAQKGEIPSARSGECFASAQGGKKLIVVGGGKDGETVPQKNIVQKDVYIFDVETSTWSKGAEAPHGFMLPACAVSGDMLLVHSGAREYSAPQYSSVSNNNSFAFYNIKKDAWSTMEYKVSASPAALSPSFVFTFAAFIAAALIL